MPCYEQLLIDKRSADYCYDENPVKNLNDQEILDKANDLLGQLTGLCDIVNGASLNDKLQDLSFLDQQAKDAISAGAIEMIKVAHENFVRIKKGFLNSFETIDLLGDFIIKQDGAILKNLLKTDFKTNENDEFEINIENPSSKIVDSDKPDFLKAIEPIFSSSDPNAYHGGRKNLDKCTISELKEKAINQIEYMISQAIQ